MIIYSIGLIVCAVFAGWVCFLINSSNNDWRKNVKAEDLESLAKFFDQ